MLTLAKPAGNSKRIPFCLTFAFTISCSFSNSSVAASSIKLRGFLADEISLAILSYSCYAP